jgi:hypothetical protein
MATLYVENVPDDLYDALPARPNKTAAQSLPKSYLYSKPMCPQKKNSSLAESF